MLSQTRPQGRKPVTGALFPKPNGSGAPVTVFLMPNAMRSGGCRALTAARHSGRVLLIAAAIDRENIQKETPRAAYCPRWAWRSRRSPLRQTARSPGNESGVGVKTPPIPDLPEPH